MPPPPEAATPEADAGSRPVTPFDRLGGHAAITAIVERFYDLMDADPAYAGLRAMHAADLAPMRRSLAGFLAGWSGGPRDWFARRPGACMMSVHSSVPVTTETAEQWVEAMRRAVQDEGVDAVLAARMDEAFTRMAGAMARR